jgi:starch synthase (maltosyl-transferring)
VNELGLPGWTRDRVVVERVRPAVDGGLYPAKRLLGERCPVSADLYKDGHDWIGARIAFRPPGETSWSYAPLTHDFNPDRWNGELRLDRIGRWVFRIEAWPDHFATWRADLRKRLDARQDVASELLEGAALLRSAAKCAAHAARRQLERAADQLAEPSRAVQKRVATALDADVFAATRGAVPEDERTCSRELELVVDRPAAGCSAWYELFPRSQAREAGHHGTFRDVIARLPELADLGFDVLYLPPIHPIGRTHRKAPNNQEGAGSEDPGSPWAIGGPEGGHTAVHPELGTLEDFDALVSRAKSVGIEIALDYALQCSPDHPWVKEHPDWFRVRPDGTIRYAENPPKKYQDIYPLDFWCRDREALWNACREIFEFWIEHGVKIFRVDNPHTKPFAFWRWVIGELQTAHPDTIFLAEAFCRPKPMMGLAKLGFTQSYTYFTWKNSAHELREYLTELAHGEMVEYFRPNFFANTPDILHEYLQVGGRPAFRIRLLLAATLSPVYGIYSGYELCENTSVRRGSEEYLDSEKYQLRARDWDAPGHIKDDIRRINQIRRKHPSLAQLPDLEFLHSENGEVIAYRKRAGTDQIIAVVVLNPWHAQESMIHLRAEQLGLPPGSPMELQDLLTDAVYTWQGDRHYVRLDPSQQPGHLLHVRSVPPERGA